VDLVVHLRGRACACFMTASTPVKYDFGEDECEGLEERADTACMSPP
jgi:hypothetical protein